MEIAWHNDQAKLEHLHFNYFVVFTKLKSTVGVDTVPPSLKAQVITFNCYVGYFELENFKGVISTAH